MRGLPALLGRSKQRFGVWQPIAFLCSSIALVGCFIALASLWSWDSHKLTGLRHDVAVAGRMPTVIAVFSAIMRTAISVQLGICYMMFATLAFEYKAVRLRDAAAMSIYRYSASSPYPLILPVLRGARLEWAGIVPSALLVLLSALSIATQLLSAILLADTDPSNIPDSVRVTFVSRALMGNQYAITVFNEPPFPKFVEVAGNETHCSEGTNGRGLVNSGILRRALIPLNSSDISSLVYYKGPAPVIDLHTTCVSPQFHNLDLKYALYGAGTLSGNISADYPTPEGIAGGAKSNCPSNAPTRKSIGEISCDLPGVRQGGWRDSFPCSVSSVCEGCNDTGYLLYRWRSSLDLPFQSRHQPPYPEEYWKRDSTGPVFDQTLPIENFKYNGTEWAKGGNASSFEIEATLCIMNTVINNATIETNVSLRNVSLPHLEYVLQEGGMSRNYSPVWTQLGLGSSSREPNDRGIFEFKSTPTTNNNFVWYLRTITSDGSPIAGNNDPPTAELYQYIIMADRKPIFQRLQSLVWLAFSSYFYSAVARSTADPDLEAKVIHLRTRIVPVHRKGFIIVCIIVAVHMISVVLIFYLFFTSNIPKFLDQAWQTIGQLHAGSAKEIIEKCGTVGDREVAEWREVKESWNSPVGFFVESSASTEEGGRVAIECKNVSKNTEASMHRIPRLI